MSRVLWLCQWYRRRPIAAGTHRERERERDRPRNHATATCENRGSAWFGVGDAEMDAPVVRNVRRRHLRCTFRIISQVPHLLHCCLGTPHPHPASPLDQRISPGDLWDDPSVPVIEVSIQSKHCWVNVFGAPINLL